MADNILEEIRVKSESLPLDKQLEVLDFVEFMVQKSAALEKKPPFRSIRGTLKGDFQNLVEDIEEMRREAWQNFPRELPAEESK